MTTRRLLSRFTIVAVAATLFATAVAPAGADTDEIETGKPMAVLEARLADIRFELDGSQREFHHVREFVETSGVDAKLTMGQVCFSNGDCNVQPVNYSIPANGLLRLKDQYIMSLTEREFYVFTYTGRDANGNDIQLSFTLVVDDDELVLQE